MRQPTVTALAAVAAASAVPPWRGAAAPSVVAHLPLTHEQTIADREMKKKWKKRQAGWLH